MWTAVETAGCDSEEGRIALEGLVKVYSRPLLNHLVAKFQASEDDAEDWLQDFLKDKIIVGDLLGKAERGRGKFRTFLLYALDNFVIDKLRHDRRQVRSPEGGWVALEDEELPEEQPCGDREAEDWALSVIDQAVSRMREACQREGQAGRWAVFKGRILDPILEGASPTPYEELVKGLTFKSPAEASNVMMTGKRMFKRTLREVVGEYAPDDVEAEIGELRRILGNRR
jgi:DNA-directed RNA polymerase specialized sigma24 family protein